MRGLPAQSRTDMAIFKDILSKVGGQKLRVFEWGSGSSTMYYSEFLKAMGRQFDWYAADNSKEWWTRGQEKVAKALLTEQVHIHCSEFPAFWELPDYSYENPIPPKEYIDSDGVKDYINHPKSLGGQFDVVIIDGRFRRRCLQVAAEVLAAEGIVILHDAHRVHYHSSLDLYPHVQFLKTGGLPGTTLKSEITLASLTESQLITELTQKYLVSEIDN